MQPDDEARAPRSSAGLIRRGRALALALALLVAVPYLAAYVRSVDDGWNASNDDALIALRVHDVLAGEWPRLGQPSTAEHYAGTETLHHPGPIEFYLMAPAVALLGADLAMPLVAGAINLGAVLVTLWVVLRRAGPAVALGAVPVVALLAWAQGPVQLVDPISSNVGGIALLALATLAWSVVDGDVRLLPLTALVFAFVAQQHLAVVGLAGGLLLWTGLGVVLSVVAWHRCGPGRGVAPWPWIAGAVGVTVVAWAPVLVDQLVGTGNLGRIITFAGASERPTLGWGAGVRQAARALGVPPLVVRTDLTGDDLHVPLSPLSWVAAGAVVACLVAVVATDRVRRPARARLAATVLVVAALGVVTGSNVPSSVEAARLNLYRWTFVVSVLTWVVLGWAAAALALRRGVRSPLGVGPVAGLVAVALVVITAAAVVGSGPTVWRDQDVFAAEAELSDAVRNELPDAARVLVVPVGRSAEFAVVPALAVDLVEAGYDLGVPPGQEAGYGSHLVASGRYDAGVVVVSGVGQANEWPGRLIARIDLNATTTEARATLADQLRGRPLTPSDRADEVLGSLMGDPSEPAAQLFATYLEELSDDPDQVLRHPSVSRALRAGYFGDLGLDQSALDLLVANPPVNSWNDDVIEARLLTPEELDRHEDALMGTGIGRPTG